LELTPRSSLPAKTIEELLRRHLHDNRPHDRRDARSVPSKWLDKLEELLARREQTVPG
jgi:hypothetical protein